MSTSVEYSTGKPIIFEKMNLCFNFQKMAQWKFFKLFDTKRCATLIFTYRPHFSHPVLTVLRTSSKNVEIPPKFRFVDYVGKKVNSSYRLSDSLVFTNFGCVKKTFFLCFFSYDHLAKKMLSCFCIAKKQEKIYKIGFSRPSM